MGIGVARPVKIVILTEQTGADGIEPLSEEVANTSAQINYISQNRQFADSRGSYQTTYEFIIRYSSTIDAVLNYNCMIEYNNRRYSIQTLERGDRVRALNKFASQFQVNPMGRYWRVVATSEDIS
jgi:hypothetical protein